eukprot:1415200-Rhodomonas_salina.1
MRRRRRMKVIRDSSAQRHRLHTPVGPFHHSSVPNLPQALRRTASHCSTGGTVGHSEPTNILSVCEPFDTPSQQLRLWGLCDGSPEVEQQVICRRH